MKCVTFAVAVVVLVLLLGVPVCAQSTQDLLEQQLQASGADGLFERLPDETKELLGRLGVDGLSLDAALAMQPQTVLSSLKDLIQAESAAPFSAALLMLGTVMLLGFLTALQPMGGERAALFHAVSALAAVTPLLVPLWQTMQRAFEAADSASVFSLSFAPVYAAMLAAQGSAATALTYQTIMIAAAQGIGVLVSGVIVPLSFVSLAFGVTGAIDPMHRLAGVGTMVSKINTWLLTVSLMIFVAMMSFQSVLATGADTVGGRMLRFSVAGFVPIVGGSLSEALYTVQGCLSTLRGTVGGFGVLCTVLIVLPTLVECVIWDLVLFFVKVVAELFSFDMIAGVVSIAKGLMKTLIAVLASSGLLMIVSLTLVTMGGAGGR